MKFEFSEGKTLESELSDNEVNNSRKNIIMKSVTSSKDWQEHAAKCRIGGKLDAVFTDDSNEGFNRQQAENTENKAVVDEDIKKQEKSKINPELMKNAEYFGVAGTRKVLAGCGCGQDVKVEIHGDAWTRYSAQNIDSGGSKGLYAQTNKDDVSAGKTEYFGGFSSSLTLRNRKRGFDLKYTGDDGSGREYG